MDTLPAFLRFITLTGYFGGDDGLLQGLTKKAGPRSALFLLDTGKRRYPLIDLIFAANTDHHNRRIRQRGSHPGFSSMDFFECCSRAHDFVVACKKRGIP